MAGDRRSLALTVGPRSASAAGSNLAPVDVILESTTVVVPDLVFVHKERLGIVMARAVEGSPDLLVEVLSKGGVRRDRGVKMKLYARFRVAHYWIADTRARTLEIRELGTRGYRLVASYQRDVRAATTLFPRLAIDLGENWV